jgi:hypothetical protein
MKRKYSEINNEGSELNLRPVKKIKTNHNFNYMQLLFNIDKKLNDLEKKINSKLNSIENRLYKLENKQRNRDEVPSYIN